MSARSRSHLSLMHQLMLVLCLCVGVFGHSSMSFAAGSLASAPPGTQATGNGTGIAPPIPDPKHWHYHWPTIDQVIINFSKLAPSIAWMMRYLAYALGFGFMITALFKFKRSAEQRSAMSGQGLELKGPMLHLITGIVLMSIPYFVDVGMQTFFNQTQPTMIPNTSNFGGSLFGSMSDKARSAAMVILQVIGFIAVIRGWILVSQLGQQGGQPGRLAKAMTHIIAGLFAMNIYGVWQLWVNTVGFGN